MKRAILRVAPELFIACLKQASARPRFWRVVNHALPDDAEFVRAAHDVNTGDLLLMLRSEAFVDVPDGYPGPELPAPQCEVVWDKETADV